MSNDIEILDDRCDTQVIVDEEDDDGEIKILGTIPNRTQTYEIPDDGILPVGPRNKGAIPRFAAITTRMIRQRKVPKSDPFTNYIARRITGSDKQDFSMIMTGRKGMGKSYSTLRIATKASIEIGKILHRPKEDFFTLDNCCLLEDTDNINKLIKNAPMYQVIVIDDAGVAVGSRDFATQKNKNFNALLSTCRTKRWFIILNVPAKSHIDKQIRELVDCWARVITKMHDCHFNILKINAVEINEANANKPYTKRYIFDKKRKVGLYAVCSPDTAMAEIYDKRRDEAAQRIIDSQITGDEKPQLTKQELHRQEMKKQYSETIVQMLNDGKSGSAVVRACPGLSDAMLRRLRADLGV
jgi:hypothetical protein